MNTIEFQVIKWYKKEEGVYFAPNKEHGNGVIRKDALLKNDQEAAPAKVQDYVWWLI